MRTAKQGSNELHWSGRFAGVAVAAALVAVNVGIGCYFLKPQKDPLVMPVASDLISEQVSSEESTENTEEVMENTTTADETQENDLYQFANVTYGFDCHSDESLHIFQLCAPDTGKSYIGLDDHSSLDIPYIDELRTDMETVAEFWGKGLSLSLGDRVNDDLVELFLDIDLPDGMELPDSYYFLMNVSFDGEILPIYNSIEEYETFGMLRADESVLSYGRSIVFNQEFYGNGFVRETYYIPVAHLLRADKKWHFDCYYQPSKNGASDVQYMILDRRVIIYNPANFYAEDYEPPFIWAPYHERPETISDPYIPADLPEEAIDETTEVSTEDPEQTVTTPETDS